MRVGRDGLKCRSKGSEMKAVLSAWKDERAEEKSKGRREAALVVRWLSGRAREA